MKLVLPSVGVTSFSELAELRAEASQFVKPFRASMLRLSKELNAAILSEASLRDVQKQAKFLVESSVLPELEELRHKMEQPSRPWHRRMVDVAKSTPELVANLAVLPTHMAVAQALAKIAELFADVRDDQLEREGGSKRGACHYLLKIEKHGQKGFLSS